MEITRSFFSRPSTLVLAPLAAAALLFFAAACADPAAEEDAAAEAEMAAGDAAMQEPGIAELVMEDNRFSILATALDSAGLVETLRSGGPYTVFAPTDSAFEALPEGTVMNLLQPENQDRLRAILTYHVVAGEVMADEVMAMASATTLEGSDLTISTVDGQVVLNPDAATPVTVVETDVAAGNGVVHVVDAVLMPPEGASEM